MLDRKIKTNYSLAANANVAAVLCEPLAFGLSLTFRKRGREPLTLTPLEPIIICHIHPHNRTAVGLPFRPRLEHKRITARCASIPL